MIKNISNIILVLATIGAIYNFFRAIKFRKQAYLERMYQSFLTNAMIENRNRCSNYKSQLHINEIYS